MNAPVTSTHPHPGTPAPEPLASAEQRRRDQLANRLVAATTATLELYSIHVGRELGLYQALTGKALTYPELADSCGIAARYSREWLEQQAVAGLLDVSHDGSAEGRRYHLPAGHQPVLVDPEDPAHVAPMADMVAGIGGVLADLPDAYRSGEGIPYAAYGAVFRRGQAGVNRPAFAHDLTTWLDALPDLVARLGTDPFARVADVGCGEGWSTLALAAALPHASIDGYDNDTASVEAARRHAARAGLDHRVSFHVADAGEPASIVGPYDLILVFEALHDFARPHHVLQGLRAACAEEGTLLLVDERVAESFTAPGDEVERLMYGWSVTHCLPASVADVPSAALGTVLRSTTVHALAGRAGFGTCSELPLSNDFFRFYRLDP